MMIWFLITLAFAMNLIYLYSIKSLMEQLKTEATDYWEKIGRPESFAANHGVAILSNLYKSEMTKVCHAAQLDGLLKLTRALLPLAFVVTGTALAVLATVLE